MKLNFLLKKTDEFTFIEPFVGSGAVLFWVLSNYPNLKKVVINDINADLIITYLSIKNSVEEMILVLHQWEKEYHNLSTNEDVKKEYYYSKRELFNTRSLDDIEHASLFIFLNRTCFNGLYRVNKSNLFNVPIGSYKTPRICDKDNLRLVCKALEKVEILNSDFENTLTQAESKTCFYLDPPYKPLSATSSFNSYAKGEFHDDEQRRLKSFCDILDKNKYQWILSNSDVNSDNKNDFFDSLYGNYEINRVMARRNINSNSKKRGELTELLITNQDGCANAV